MGCYETSRANFPFPIELVQIPSDLKWNKPGERGGGREREGVSPALEKGVIDG